MKLLMKVLWHNQFGRNVHKLCIKKLTKTSVENLTHFGNEQNRIVLSLWQKNIFC